MASIIVTDSTFKVKDEFGTSANKKSYSAGMRQFGNRLDGDWANTPEADRPKLVFNVFNGLLKEGFKVYRIRDKASDNLRFKVLRDPKFVPGNPAKIVWTMVRKNGTVQFELVFRKDRRLKMVVSLPNSDDIQGYQNTNVEIVQAHKGDAARDFLVAASMISRCR